MITGITTLYWVYAGQVSYYLLTQRRRLNRRKTVALGSHLSVFLLCGFCGYQSTLLNLGDYVREGAHWVLLSVTFVMVATRQARAMAEMLE